MKRIFVGIILVLLLTGISALAFNIQPVRSEFRTWSGTVYIRADGSVDPIDAPISTVDKVTYTLTDNIVGDVPDYSSAVVVERDNIVVDGAGYTVQGTGSGTGIGLPRKSNVTLKNIQITAFYFGIYLDSSSNNGIIENNITNNMRGIWLYSSSNYNSIVGNNITNNGEGIELVSSNYNSIVGNNITSNYLGIWLYYSSNYNSIAGNKISNNSEDGVYLYKSSNNSIIENHITNSSYYGIRLYSSSNNRFYHNNIIDNNQQVYIETSDYANVWDNGYPSGGNYWSDYNGTDLDSDGIGDTPYVIDDDNRDCYPLMAPIGFYDAVVGIISNSTVSGFELDVAEKTLSFNVTGTDLTTGFCRIIIPNNVTQNLWHNNYTVLIDGKPLTFKNWTDPKSTYIYFNYTHSTRQVKIIPEFPSTMLLPLFTLTTLIATILLKKKRKTKPQLP
ncbi:hypothetical protein G4O51_12660 [Candidatus Bathyarchaeota archaeon A05DMB-2]|nr:hypothetical protein [Candidatus Bathyarchaeota archaeon A05DMB-2]